MKIRAAVSAIDFEMGQQLLGHPGKYKIFSSSKNALEY
jgi:hypothetical protein